jgi:hypothetical protein
MTATVTFNGTEWEVRQYGGTDTLHRNPSRIRAIGWAEANGYADVIVRKPMRCVDGDPRCVGPVASARGFMCEECSGDLADAAEEAVDHGHGSADQRAYVQRRRETDRYARMGGGR